MNVLFLAYHHGFNPGAFAHFGSDTSCFDFDVVVWDPGNVIDEYTGYYGEYYRGLPSLGDSASVRIRSDINRRRAEFREFVDGGRVLVVIARPPQGFYYDTGDRSHSGTGRNRSTTVLVKADDVWRALPADLKMTKAGGTNMQFVGTRPFSDLWREIKDCVRYEATIEAEGWSPLAKVSGTEKVVAAVYKAKSGGMVVLLPAPVFPDREELDDDETGDDVEVEGRDGVETDEDDEDDPDDDDDDDGGVDDAPAGDDDDTAYRFQLAIRELVEALRASSDVEPPPAWSADYLLKGEQAIRDAIVAKEREIESARGELAGLQADMDALANRKRLVTATGKALEFEVRKVLEALGGTVTEGDPGRDDWKVAFPEGPAVVEVKGLTGSAGEKDAAQLEKWVANHLEETGEPAKGLLVVNGWRKKPLAERTEPVFPDQMLKYSKARERCLVTGLQLLGIMQAVEAKPESAASWRKKLMTTTGPLKAPDDWMDIVAPAPLEAEASSQATSTP